LETQPRISRRLGKVEYEACCRIYFIEAVGLNVVKIGFAKDIAERMRKLRVGCPAPLRLLGTLPGGIREERDLHCTLAKHQAHGEWFRRCPELDAILATIEPSDIAPAKAGHRPFDDPRTAAEIAARL
jgi:hypothetical protein